MQTRFQIREIDVSKGYCLLVTDKTQAAVVVQFLLPLRTASGNQLLDELRVVEAMVGSTSVF